MRLWDATKRVCLFTVPIGLQLPTPSTFQGVLDSGGGGALAWVLADIYPEQWGPQGTTGFVADMF
jgi:hypothetical protein